MARLFLLGEKVQRVVVVGDVREDIIRALHDNEAPRREAIDEQKLGLSAARLGDRLGRVPLDEGTRALDCSLSVTVRRKREELHLGPVA